MCDSKSRGLVYHTHNCKHQLNLKIDKSNSSGKYNGTKNAQNNSKQLLSWFDHILRYKETAKRVPEGKIILEKKRGRVRQAKKTGKHWSINADLHGKTLVSTRQQWNGMIKSVTPSPVMMVFKMNTRSKLMVAIYRTKLLCVLQFDTLWYARKELFKMFSQWYMACSQLKCMCYQ